MKVEKANQTPNPMRPEDKFTPYNPNPNPNP